MALDTVGPERERVEAGVEHVADVVVADLVAQGVPCAAITRRGTVDLASVLVR
jgi:hypothetical protein